MQLGTSVGGVCGGFVCLISSCLLPNSTWCGDSIVMYSYKCAKRFFKLILRFSEPCVNVVFANPRNRTPSVVGQTPCTGRLRVATNRCMYV